MFFSPNGLFCPAFRLDKLVPTRKGDPPLSSSKKGTKPGNKRTIRPTTPRPLRQG